MRRALRLGSLLVIGLIVLLAYPALPLPLAVGQEAPVPPPVSTQGTLAGFVLSDVGFPLGGARVHAEGAGTSSEAVSNADGSYALGLASGVWNITVSAAGHATRNASAVVAPAGTAQNYTLDHTGSVVRGTVRDGASGRGVADAVVSADPGYDCKSSPCPMAADTRPILYRPPTSTVTARDGSYALAVEPGTVVLAASKAGYGDTSQQVDASKDAQQDLKLLAIPPQSAVLQGTVTDAKTGQPLADAWVSAYPNVMYAQPAPASAPPADANSTSAGSGGAAAPSGAIAMPCYGCGPYPQGNSTQTDRSGHYRMAMFPGTYNLNVGAQDHGSWSEQVVLADNQTLTRDAKLAPIPPDSVRIHGQVLDAATGKPVPGAYVSIENPQWGGYNGTQAGSDGSFDLRTKPGWSLVWVRADVYGYPVPVAVPACPPEADCVAKGEPNPGAPAQPGKAYYPWAQGGSYAEGQDVPLAPKLQPKPAADVPIKGYVLNASSGKPIPGAWVNVHNEDTGDWGQVQTDQDGSYSLLGRAGVHTLTAYGDGYFQNAVVASVPEQGLRVDLHLEPGRSNGGGCCIAYAEGRATAAPAPAAAPAAGGPAAAGAGDSTAGMASVQGSGAQTYKSAPGLGPYDASSAPANGTGALPAGGAKAPGFEAALLLGAVGVALLALRRR
jgi:protocatechuate 3,4-dioxygenase beta subunit